MHLKTKFVFPSVDLIPKAVYETIMMDKNGYNGPRSPAGLVDRTRSPTFHILV